ncbi:Kynureninase (L-kynurenine hydrolase) [Thecaphora frezii]
MSAPTAASTDDAASAQKDLQSMLLRSTIICATSIQSLREPVQPDVLASTSKQLPLLASQLSTQILNDITQILTLVQKHSNALSLALRPSFSSSSNAAPSQPSNGFSPVSGLDAKSIEAAKAQIVSLSNDLIPKMVFIAKKAWKDREVFQVDAELAAQRKHAAQQEKEKLAQLAKEMGGKVMTSEQLGLGGDDSVDPVALKKLVPHSLGNAFAREVRSAVEDVLGCIAELLQSFLDSRTRAVLQQASNARDRADGLAPSATNGASAYRTPQSVEEARRKSLELNNLVWETCAKYIGQRASDGSPVTITHVNPNGNKVRIQVQGLSRDNLEASKRIWQQRVALMRDGLEEMQQVADSDATAASPQPDRGQDDDDDDDGFDLGEELSAPPTLSEQERKRLSQLSNLVKIGNILHENTLKAIVAAHTKDSMLDLDKVEELARELEEAQDEIVAATVYGEEDAGLEELDLGDDDEEGDEEEDDDNDKNEAEPAVEEGSIEAAVLRTLLQYVRAAAALVSYVGGNDQFIERVDAIGRESPAGDFEQIFDARFSKLSKILADASSKLQVRPSAPAASANTEGRPAAAFTAKAVAVTAAVAEDPAPKEKKDAVPAVAEASAALSVANAGAKGKQPEPVGVIPKQDNHSFKTEVFVQELEAVAQQLGPGVKITDRAVAEQLDRNDPLAPMRDGYVLPKNKDVCQGATSPTTKSGEEAPEAPALYMCGNSLGPLAKLTRTFLDEELDAWGRKAVLGHFDHPYDRPWTQLETRVGELTADIVGAKRSEVTVMGTLTGNLHTMLTTFYRPAVKPFGVGYNGSLEQAKREGKKVRHKIVYEHKAFPSDRYALASAIELNGFSVETSLVPLKPEGDRRTLETADILATIDELGKEGETALILLGGVQYFTGQFFELDKIGAKAREHGIVFGVDLAHAFANVPLRLHDWGVDFAVWCTYKYGSAGPGGIAGLFVHENWTSSASNMLTRQAGWWGHDRATRFSMPEEFAPIGGAEGWQVSNPSMLDVTALRGSLETLRKAAELAAHDGGDAGAVSEGGVGEGKIMPVLRSKSLRLTAYLETLLLSPGFLPKGLGIEIVTPRDPLQRGSQLCIRIPDQRELSAAAATTAAPNAAEGSAEEGKGLPPPVQSTRLIARAHSRAERERGLVTDIRHPDMLRIAPLAQFSSFTEVWRTAEALRLSILEELEQEKSGGAGDGSSQ